LAEVATTAVTRREVMLAGSAAAAAALLAESARADDDTVELVKRLTGKTPTQSDRVHLVMPRTFPNGYTVPLDLTIDSAMTEADHVKHVRVVAPRNPLIEVADFRFSLQRCQPRISTRIRLAEPQFVVAIAEMSDGAVLVSKTWVDVATNGCA
jgi:sulfur-oxidizing protein SoxY